MLREFSMITISVIFLVFTAGTIKNLTTEENQSQIQQIPFLTFLRVQKNIFRDF